MNKAQRLRNAILGAFVKSPTPTPPPPAGDYTPTKSTKMTGTQWADLGIKADSTCEVMIKLKGANNAFGTASWSGSKSLYILSTTQENGWITMAFGQGNNKGVRRGYPEGEYDVYEQNVNEQIVNGTSYPTANQNAWVSDLNIYIGATSYPNGFQGSKFSGEIAAFSLKRAGVLEMELIPCIYNDEGGFWCSVSNKFIGSTSGTPFIAGEII